MTESPQHSPEIVVILVEPEDSINVGSVARAMSNLGFSELRLVTPHEFCKHRAAISACWGEDLLDTVREYDELDAAIADCSEVYGFSSQPGKHRIGLENLENWVASLSFGTRVGLLFGPESTGLRPHHWRDCVALVRIPSCASNPSFNLAQAVLLSLYELRRRFPFVERNQPPKPGGLRKALEPATISQMRQLDSAIDELGRRGGFLNENSPRDMSHLLHHLFRRIRPSNREVSCLLGLFSQASRKLEDK